MSKEVAIILVNGAAALVVVFFMCLGRLSLETGGAIIGALAMPSGISALAKLRGGHEESTAKGPPGPSAMLLLLAMGFVTLPTSTACTPAAAPRQELPSFCYDEAAFGLELENCVRKAKASGGTLDDSRACRSEVHRTCGYSEPDRGAR